MGAISQGDRPARISSLLARLWDNGLLTRPDLTRVLDEAEAVAARIGADGTAPWHQALERLLDSLTTEAALSPLGLTFAYVQLKGLLASRERAAALWAREPEVARVPIRAPIIVLGHMRSGTTRLQRLLGCDPRFNHSHFFEMREPVPPAGPDLRVLKASMELAALNALNPQLRSVHPSSATAVEEVFGLFSFSFYGAQIEAQWRTPGFSRFWEAADRGWVFAEFRQLLQTIAWSRGADDRPWVLKAPQFMEDLDALLAMFPDARLICLQRDLAQVVGSSASLVWHQMRVQSDSADPEWIGAEWLRKTVRRERLCGEVRQANAHVPQIDVTFDAMNRDWLGEMRRIYAFLGIDLTTDVARRMQAYLDRAEKSGFRRHGYSLDAFGLSADLIRARMGPVVSEAA